MSFRLIPLFFILFLPLALSAQNADAQEEDQPIPFFDVEVVLFKNLQGPRGFEYVRPTSLPTRTESTVEIQSRESIKAAADLGYSLLQDDEFRLIEQVGKIIESPRYELMLHAAWRQPGLELEQSTPVWIRGGNLFGSEYSSIDFTPSSEPTASQIAESIDNPDPAAGIDPDDLAAEQRELDAVLELTPENAAEMGQRQSTVGGLYELEGKITVSLSRYLHVNADLVMRKPRPSGYNQTTVYTPQNTNLQNSKILENHRLQERRRMRSATLHYLDNPQFSMLVMISRYETPAESNDAASATATE